MKVITVDNMTGAIKLVKGEDICIGDQVIWVVADEQPKYTASQIVEYYDNIALLGAATASVLLANPEFEHVGVFNSLDAFYNYMCDELVDDCIKDYVDMEDYIEDTMTYIVVDNNYFLTNK